MACSTGTCQSGCYKDNNEDEEVRLPTEKKEATNGVLPSGNDIDHHHNLCLKCKVNEATTTAGGGGGDGGRFCADCFRSNLFGKFRFAVTSNAMISPSDKVLVAFSGGPSSRVALQFVHEMQHKAQKNFDASRDRSLPVFGVGVAFIDENSIYPVPSHEFDKAIEEMKLVVSNLAPPRKEFHVASIGSIYSPDSSDGGERLKELLNAISDVTGKEDLLLHLRMLSLQKIALENGYTKLVLGSCTSRIACHVISATVKGQGYSLAADIQYVDARWEIPVVLPLRDCLAQELNMLCCLDRAD
uniref:Putative cytoplasmic tRNA 2-thiolation protein 2 n=1 Tax=Davidia involucrata TaxID=16924 RepID=A0A5B7B7P3_DAVIN